MIQMSKVTNLQSLDEMGNWHVYFTVPGFYQGDVTVKGFHEPDGTVEVPEELDISQYGICRNDNRSGDKHHRQNNRGFSCN